MLFGVEFIYVLAGIFGAAIIVLIYFFRIKPVIEYAIPNAPDRGTWTVPLPMLGKTNVGPVNPAYDYLQKDWSKLIATADDTAKKSLVEYRDDMLARFPYAQRVERQKVMYFFDEDPMSPTHSITIPGKNNQLWIGPPHDAVLTKYRDWEIISLKIGVDIKPFTEEQRKRETSIVEGVSYIRCAADSQGKIKFLQDQHKTSEEEKAELRKQLAEMTARCDRALSALGQHGLSEGMQPKIATGFGQKLKEWFTWPQLISAAAFYFIVSPILMSAFFSSATPPTTTYITAFITVLGFFSIPVFKKLFGRWL